MAISPTIIFDFVHKQVITAGVNAEADRQVQEFLKQQVTQAGSSPGRSNPE